MKIYEKPQICAIHLHVADTVLTETSITVYNNNDPIDGNQALAKPGQINWEDWDYFNEEKESE